MTVELVGYRVAAHDTPLWVSPNVRAGRFNAAGDPPTQYLCLHPLGPWAEVLRWNGLRTRRDVEDLATRLWALRVVLDAGPVRVGFGDAHAHGVTAADLVGDDHGPCQRLARAHRAAGTTALRVPSAALPGTGNLVLLGPRVMVPYVVAPVDDVDVPAAVAADRAGVPLSVLPHVRHRGEPHAGLDAHLAGGPPFVFPDPPAPLP